jgi:alkanesulfonate monooxygenase SsuD/methylene tetrahydromethanopterin reductase-like flavin-dependent oxidoreductase (luciferase family)
LVTGLPYRHPAVLANMAAALDIVSGGRLELGIGAGWNEVEAKAYGIDLHPTLTERFDAFDEGCEAIIGLLTNESTTFDGRYVQLVDARCNPKPVQRPHPPICIGGQGERRTLRSVARYAQHWNYPGGPVEQFAAKLDVLRAHCADVGRDPSEITISTHLRGSPGELVEQAKRYGDAGLDLGIVYLQPPHTPDVLGEIADALEPLRG